MPKAHSTPHDKVHELVQAIEGLDVNVFQQIVGRAALKHGLEFFPKMKENIMIKERLTMPHHN